MEQEITQILTAVIASLGYSVTFFIKHKADDEPEDFEPRKFAATALVGIGVGVTFTLSGIDLSYASFEEQLVAYGGTIALVESALKTVIRVVKKKYDI